MSEFEPVPINLSMREELVALSDSDAALLVSRMLVDARCFSDHEIGWIVAWLIAFRAAHRLDVIE